jgi:hypothetical protein
MPAVSQHLSPQRVLLRLLQIFRFYYRCTNCAAEFCMKTDPKTSDYVMEEGASRNYEPWREVRDSNSSSLCTDQHGGC